MYYTYIYICTVCIVCVLANCFVGDNQEVEIKYS